MEASILGIYPLHREFLELIIIWLKSDGEKNLLVNISDYEWMVDVSIVG